MAVCEKCGNDYDKAFEVSIGGESHVFDSFECAISALAPRCEQCDCWNIGHAVEGSGRMFCCANCAQQKGVTAAKDRVKA